MRNQKGFTLVELLVALLIMVNIMAASGMALIWSVRYFQLVSQRRQGTDQAVMALRLIETQMARASCTTSAVCGDPPDPAQVINAPAQGATGNTLTGRIQNAAGAFTFFRFEYDGFAPGTLTFCTPADFVTACAASGNGLVVARNIMNGATAMFRRNVAPTATTIQAVVMVREGQEGATNRTRTYQSSFTAGFSN